MKPGMRRYYYWIHHICVLFFCLSSTLTVHARENAVAVLLSQEIAPYVATVNGIDTELVNVQVERFFLDRHGLPFNLVSQTPSLDSGYYSALVAIGPQALQYLHSLDTNTPVLFGMVLNPSHIIPDPLELRCGVSLNLPIESQFKSLVLHFPWMKRLGVLFDPKNNQLWFDQAAQIATAMGIELVPLQVEPDNGRLRIVGDLSRPDVLLFIPDKSVISTVMIQHVIKRAVLHQIPVVGYNQFFIDSGAALSFVIDYNDIGHQVGVQVKTLLTTGNCDGFHDPNYEIRINTDVWRLLKLEQRGGAHEL